ncbi:metal-dependent hydrolase [Halobacteriales archaeon QS_1_68_20]|nr:MAG: metal-dependent hydrolase [Halobacteriales archaeon QS_1_68_20]
MPDLLAHVLLAYAVAQALSWRYRWLSPAYVTVVMAGAMIPDLSKAAMVLPGTRVEALLGVPFDWFALHTSGGVLLSILVGVALVAPTERRRVFLLLALGAATHLFADALLLKPSGRSYPVFWPLTRYHPPTPGLYLSTEPRPAVVAAVAALVARVVTRRHGDHEAGTD